MTLETDSTTAARRPLPIWAWLLVGVAAATLGLGPWLLHGARLPLQNLWGDATASAAMPIALLPFSQYSIHLLTALLMVGSAAAGIAARAGRWRRPRFAVLAVVVGVLLVQLTALVQTAVVVRQGLSAQRWSVYYVAALVAGTVLAMGIGILVLLLVASAPVPAATIALAVAAVTASWWLGGLILPLGTTELPPTWVSWILRWLPAVLVGLAIAWGGFRTPGRVVAAVVSLAALWIGPALATGLLNAVGSRVLAKHPGEMAEYALTVFRSALTLPELVVPPLVVAAVVGVAGSLALTLIGRRARPDSGEPAPAEG